MTTGDLWQFGLLDEAQRIITKDIDEFLLPRDLEHVVGRLLGLLGD